jgi:hypothetical protein
MKLILDTLERARLSAAPAEADALRVALIDLEALADALNRNGADLVDAACALDDLKDVREHVAANPLAQTRPDDNLSATLARLVEWTETLEGLAE